MAVNLQYPTQTVASVQVVETEQDGEPGYLIWLDQKLQWIPKEDADTIARYILFGEDPEAETGEPDQPPA